MNKIIKDAVKRLKPSATLQINEETKRLESQGKKVYKFGFGQSPFPVPEIVKNELKNNVHQNKYLSMQGLFELREAVAIYLNKKSRLVRWFALLYHLYIHTIYDNKNMYTYIHT